MYDPSTTIAILLLIRRTNCSIQNNYCVWLQRSHQYSVQVHMCNYEWPCLACRFIGTTLDSSSIVSLLTSVTKQIKTIYQSPPTVSGVRCYIHGHAQVKYVGLDQNDMLKYLHRPRPVQPAQVRSVSRHQIGSCDTIILCHHDNNHQGRVNPGHGTNSGHVTLPSRVTMNHTETSYKYNMFTAIGANSVHLCTLTY
jgi:hypothetical protein